jgi:glycosyltransferase involved in cell wall biosynthesis
MGHKVLCLAPDLSPALIVDLGKLGAEARGYPLDRTGLNPLADLKSLKSLASIFRNWRPDAVMGYTPKPAIYASLAAKIARTRRIVPMVTGLGYGFLDGGGVKRQVVRAGMRRLYRLALRGSHGVIFHNRDDRMVLENAGAIPRGTKVHVVAGSGVDLTHYGRQPMPAGGTPLTFLMVSRLLKGKGIAEYCEAAKLLKQSASSARFVLAGPEDSSPDGFKAADLAAFADAIDYRGRVEDPRPLYGECHVYVLPSHGEGMPRTVLEAMAAGRPIITTDARGCRETVDERVNGCLVPIGDAYALAAAMRSFCEHPELIPSMGEASRRKAERRFDVNLVNAEMVEILTAVDARRT